jgi:hypothetical protein
VHPPRTQQESQEEILEDINKKEDCPVVINSTAAAITLEWLAYKVCGICNLCNICMCALLLLPLDRSLLMALTNSAFLIEQLLRYPNVPLSMKKFA